MQPLLILECSSISHDQLVFLAMQVWSIMKYILQCALKLSCWFTRENGRRWWRPRHVAATIAARSENKSCFIQFVNGSLNMHAGAMEEGCAKSVRLIACKEPLLLLVTRSHFLKPWWNWVQGTAPLNTPEDSTSIPHMAVRTCGSKNPWWHIWAVSFAHSAAGDLMASELLTSGAPVAHFQTQSFTFAALWTLCALCPFLCGSFAESNNWASAISVALSPPCYRCSQCTPLKRRSRQSFALGWHGTPANHARGNPMGVLTKAFAGRSMDVHIRLKSCDLCFFDGLTLWCSLHSLCISPTIRCNDAWTWSRSVQSLCNRRSGRRLGHLVVTCSHLVWIKSSIFFHDVLQQHTAHSGIDIVQTAPMPKQPHFFDSRENYLNACSYNVAWWITRSGRQRDECFIIICMAQVFCCLSLQGMTKFNFVFGVSNSQLGLCFS